MSDAISFDAPEPDELSAHLENYDVSSLIAVGGMGAVYHANQTSLDRDVAIKLLPAEFGGDDTRCRCGCVAHGIFQSASIAIRCGGRAACDPVEDG